MELEMPFWTMCQECKGLGKKYRRLRKKLRLRHQEALAQYEKNNRQGEAPNRPKGAPYACLECSGSGLTAASQFLEPDTGNYPHVAIVGGGIGGTALAVACRHRGIPFTLYERDSSFDSRSQGYGLTLQQASREMERFGLFSLEKGLVSTRHLVHTPDGKVIGEWGMRKWMPFKKKSAPKRTNIHIARQSLRLAILQQLGGHEQVEWGHQLVDYKNNIDGLELHFEVDGKIMTKQADILVGADGIRSTVRKLSIGEELAPLQYLGCIVILGICPLSNLKDFDNPLLDSATVFQTANGNERIYMMPFDVESVMWQLSFPIPEEEAKTLSAKGPQALKEEACRRVPWHDPIPQILEATKAAQISGYPVYDRALIEANWLEQHQRVTLLGDAAHPLSPFKGQGANQALLDALALARGISIGCRPLSNWRDVGIRISVLKEFEAKMIARTKSKVKDSREAARYLHSDIVLMETNKPRGSFLKIEEE